MALIQVADNLDNEKTRQREIGSLTRAMEELKLKMAFILTEDTEEEFSLRGKMISIKPIYKWLLEGASR